MSGNDKKLFPLLQEQLTKQPQKHTSKKINKVNESKNILPGVVCNTASVRWNKQRNQCLVQLRFRNRWIDSFCQAIWWIDDDHWRWAHKIPDLSFSSCVLTEVGYYSHRESTFILSAGASCVQNSHAESLLSSSGEPWLVRHILSHSSRLSL